jgi:hypothetical protein
MFDRKMVARIRPAACVLLIATMTGCGTTQFYTSQKSKRDVAECIYKGWKEAPSAFAFPPVPITDFTEYYYVGSPQANIWLPKKHPESVVWAEIRDLGDGSSTEFYRSFGQIYRKLFDRVVADCQKPDGATSPIPFVTSDSAEYATLEGTFTDRSKFDWDDLSVEAVDDRFFITKPIDGRKSSVVAKVSPGEHEITVNFSYNRNGWPRIGAATLSANLFVGKTYKLRSELEGSEYRVELYDKDTGQVISKPVKAKGSGM